VDKFDVVIVGAGPAGTTAANILAKAGLQVVVIERGQTPGSKNVSGGLVFSRIFHEIYPNFWEEAPIERAIRGHGIIFLGEGSSTALDFRSDEASSPPFNAFSVLRAKFDPWMAKQAEQAGAMVISGYTVDELLLDNGKVCGVKAGEDELLADIVIVAEGTRSQLLKEAGLRDDFHAKDVSLGVKEIVKLSEEIINERFQCNSGEGMAYTTVGNTGGVAGGGFLYTNKDTLSLGVVVKIESLYKSGKQPHEILDEFKNHPSIERMISGGDVVEYSAQTVHRGGFHLIPQLYGDGYLVAGSAASLLLNNVMTLRGMDLAVASAAAAAHAVLAAKEKNDFSAKSLSKYAQFFQITSAYKDLETFKGTYSLMENTLLFNTYPNLICSVMEDMFSVKTTPGKKVFQSLRDNMGENVSYLDLVKTFFQVWKGIVL